MHGWIGVDLDGTLAEYHTWQGAASIGKPIQPMVDRVKKWLSEGKTVKIFTARVNPKSSGAELARTAIAAWTNEVFGVELESTHEKDYGMIAVYDDRAVAILRNKGIPYLSMGVYAPPRG